MKSNHPALISGALFLVMGLALAAMLFTGVLPHCRHDMPGLCYAMTQGAGGAALVLAVLGLAMMLARTAAVALGLAIGAFLNAVLVFGIAGPLIGPCPSPMMHCHSITQPVLFAAAAVAALIALIEMWRLAKH